MDRYKCRYYIFSFLPRWTFGLVSDREREKVMRENETHRECLPLYRLGVGGDEETL